jgi:hypothetical protein
VTHETGDVRQVIERMRRGSAVCAPSCRERGYPVNTWCERCQIDFFDEASRAQAAEIALLKSDLERARYAPLGDNHHNAAACPHCRGRDLIASGQWTRDGGGELCWFWIWAAKPTSWMPLPPAPGQNAVDALPSAPEVKDASLYVGTPCVACKGTGLVMEPDAKDALPPGPEGATATLEQDAPPGCRASRDGFTCTRQRGHSGDHVAHGEFGRVWARWPESDVSPAKPADLLLDKSERQRILTVEKALRAKHLGFDDRLELADELHRIARPIKVILHKDDASPKEPRA